MTQFVYLKNTPKFTIKTFKEKKFKTWDATNKKMLTSDTWQTGYKASYQFELDNGDILDLSKDQVGQMLVGSLEARKPLAGLTFVAKDNGKEGLEKRWFINLMRDAGRETGVLPSEAPKAPQKPVLSEIQPSEVNPDEIPF